MATNVTTSKPGDIGLRIRNEMRRVRPGRDSVLNENLQIRGLGFVYMSAQGSLEFDRLMSQPLPEWNDRRWEASVRVTGVFHPTGYQWQAKMTVLQALLFRHVYLKPSHDGRVSMDIHMVQGPALYPSNTFNSLDQRAAVPGVVREKNLSQALTFLMTTLQLERFVRVGKSKEKVMLVLDEEQDPAQLALANNADILVNGRAYPTEGKDPLFAWSRYFSGVSRKTGRAKAFPKVADQVSYEEIMPTRVMPFVQFPNDADAAVAVAGGMAFLTDVTGMSLLARGLLQQELPGIPDTVLKTSAHLWVEHCPVPGMYLHVWAGIPWLKALCGRHDDDSVTAFKTLDLVPYNGVDGGPLLAVRVSSNGKALRSLLTALEEEFTKKARFPLSDDGLYLQFVPSTGFAYLGDTTGTIRNARINVLRGPYPFLLPLLADRVPDLWWNHWYDRVLSKKSHHDEPVAEPAADTSEETPAEPTTEKPAAKPRTKKSAAK